MAVYVNPLFDTDGWSEKWPYKQACHMTADSSEELMLFAERLGIKSRWLQKGGLVGREHFDLTPAKRVQAVRLGAIEITVSQAVAQMRAAIESAKYEKEQRRCPHGSSSHRCIECDAPICYRCGLYRFSGYDYCSAHRPVLAARISGG